MGLHWSDMGKKKYKAVVTSVTKKGTTTWWYTCDCPKLNGGSVGPFDLENLAKDVANLHNVAEDDH